VSRKSRNAFQSTPLASGTSMVQQTKRAEIVSLTAGAYQTPEEAEWLANKVSRLRPRRIIEIGVAEGGLSRLFCHIVGLEGRVVGLDLTDALVAEDVKRSPNYTLILGSSHDPAILARVRQISDQFDVLFIDGDHSVDGVLKDTQDYLPLVREGGLVLWHDVRLEPDQGIKEVWYRQLRPKLIGSEEFFVDPYNNGLGAWHKTSLTVRGALESAQESIGKERVADAQRLLDLVATSDPYQPSLWSLYADLEELRGNAAGLATALAKALIVSPRDASLRKRAASALSANGQYGILQEAWSLAAPASPSPRHALQQADLAQKLGLLDCAVEVLRSKLAAEPFNLAVAAKLLDLLRENNAGQQDLMDTVVQVLTALPDNEDDDKRFHEIFDDRIYEIQHANFRLQKYAWVPEFAIRLTTLRRSLASVALRGARDIDPSTDRFTLLRQALHKRVAELPELAGV
jgi:predicted O-methyltransferase YrrM